MASLEKLDVFFPGDLRRPSPGPVPQTVELLLVLSLVHRDSHHALIHNKSTGYIFFLNIKVLSIKASPVSPGLPVGQVKGYASFIPKSAPLQKPHSYHPALPGTAKKTAGVHII